MAFNVTEFLQHLEKLIDNNFILDEKYQKRRKDQISFIKDTHNCERCFDAIINCKKITQSNPSKIKIVPNYYNKYTGKYTPEPFTGLTEEW